MTQEEKAKAYDEAVEKLRNAFYCKNSRMCDEYRKAVISIIEPIFPELKESEDERIRKEIIRIVDIWTNSCPTVNGIPVETLLAWLEKQQKPTWSREDENGLNDALWAIQQAGTIAKDENDAGNLWYAENWLKSLKERMKGE